MPSDAMQTAKLSDALYRLLHVTYGELRPGMWAYWRRIENLQWFRRARLGAAANDGTFGGRGACLRIMQTTEAEICQHYT